MKREITSNFNGILKIKDQEKVHEAFFHVDGDVVTVIPCTPECREAIYKSTDTDVPEKNEDDAWLYGIAEDGNRVAFFHPNKFSVSIFAPVSLGIARFHTPILLKSTSVCINDLDRFDAIEFRGGIIDILYPTGKAVDERYSEKYIKFHEQEHFTKSFPINLDGENFKIIYSISLSDLSIDTGKVPDLREGIHSVLRFEFSKSQPIYKFQTYYYYALQFFQFCSGQLNVNFDVRLFIKKSSSTTMVLTRIRDGFDDYADELLDVMRVIRFDYLGEKFPNVFKVINEKDKVPYLLFLPKRNKNVGKILYTDVSDICVSLEREYDLTYIDSIKNGREDAKKLSEELNRFIDKSNHEENVKYKAKNIINGILLNLKPSLKEKIDALFNEFSMVIKDISEPKDRVEFGVIKQYSADEFKQMIKKFIEIRNRASHAGIVWNDGVEIFSHLHLLVYVNILKRAGYNISESKCILSYLFSRKF